MQILLISLMIQFVIFNFNFFLQKSVLSSHSLLYFADMCAGPGGFSEYVLWRRKGDAKGFGLTLRDSNDFKLEEFFAGPSQMFEPHYGEYQSVPCLGYDDELYPAASDRDGSL